MTDKLKCPFCGTEFDIMKSISDSVLGCPKCKHIATIGIWEALIDGKKAQNAIQKIKDIVYLALDREFYSELRDDMLYISRIIVSVEKQE